MSPLRADLDAQARLQSDGTEPVFRRLVRSCRRWQLNVASCFTRILQPRHAPQVSRPTSKPGRPHWTHTQCKAPGRGFKAWVRISAGATGRTASMRAQRARLVAVPVAVLLRCALVVLLLTFREANGELRAVLAPVELERDERVPLALDEPGEPVDLPAIQEELANPRGIGLHVRRRGIERSDVRAEQPGFALA